MRTVPVLAPGCYRKATRKNARRPSTFCAAPLRRMPAQQRLSAR